MNENISSLSFLLNGKGLLCQSPTASMTFMMVEEEPSIICCIHESLGFPGDLVHLLRAWVMFNAADNSTGFDTMRHCVLLSRQQTI